MDFASSFHSLVRCGGRLWIVPGLIAVLTNCSGSQPGKLPNRISTTGGIMALPPVDVVVAGKPAIDKVRDAAVPPDATIDAQAGNAGSSGTMSSEAGMSIDDDSDAGIECKPLSKPVDVSWAPKCPSAICASGDGVCLSQPDLANMAPRVKLDDLGKCDDARYCVPIAIATQGGRGVGKPCTSLNKSEGRCMSRCLPKVAAQEQVLPQDDCSAEELCMPCYDPRTGADTGACHEGCDTGPTEPPALYPKCCSDRGLCLPPSVSGVQSLDLKQDTCAAGDMCTPIELSAPTFKPKSCDSVGGTEGRCLSKCIGGALGALQTRVLTIGCAKKEFCAPCFDPLTGEETGACSIHGDMPTRSRTVFPHCCGTDLGVCVPPEFVGLQSLALDQAGCDLGNLCAPIGPAPDAATRYPSCNALGGGACVPECFINSTVKPLLMQDSCGSGQLCTPCSLIGTGNNVCSK